MEVLNFSRLSEDCTIQGTIAVQGDFYIAGKIIGDLTMTGPGIILIEPKGELEGVIHCSDLQILGTVRGKIHSTGNVTIKASGQVYGQLHSQSLKIMPGAKLELDVAIEDAHLP